MPKLKFRELCARVPALEKLRVWLIGGVIHVGLDQLSRSWTWTYDVPKATKRYVDGDAPCIFAVYHGRMFQMMQIMPDRLMFNILVSASRDGEITSRGVSGLGFRLVRGSTGRGGVRATKALVDAAKSGRSIVVTVDGPRGPATVVKAGISRLSKLTGLPIVPAVASANKFRRIWTWDGFIAPKFFSETLSAYGEPIPALDSNDEDAVEAHRLSIEMSMLELAKTADVYWKERSQQKAFSDANSRELVSGTFASG